MAGFGVQQNIVIFAPHPDDETIGCGGTIARKLSVGYEVYVVVMTSGDQLFSVVLDIHTNPTPAEVGALRQEETRRATKILGVKPENLIFWDYHDQGLTEAQDTIAKNVTDLLRQLSPVEVYYHTEHEHHPDHQAANRIVRQALSAWGEGRIPE